MVETTEDWWGLESPTTSYPQRSPYEGFEVLAKSNSSKPSPGGHGSTLFSCFRPSSNVLHLTEADLETNTPPRSETVLMQAPCTSLSSGNDTKFMEVEAVDPQHGCSGYEPNQFRIYSNAEPTSPVVNCIGQVRPKKKPKAQRCNIATKREPGAAAAPARCNESLMLQGTKLTYSLSPIRSGGAAVVLPARRVAKCKSAGKWKQLLQRSSSANSISPR